MGSGTRLQCRFPNMSCGLLPLPFSITIEAHLNPCPWVLTYALAWSLTPPEMNPWPKWKAAKSMGRPNSAVRRLDSHETPKHQTPPSNGRCLDLHETPKHHLPQSIWAVRPLARHPQTRELHTPPSNGECMDSHETPKMPQRNGECRASHDTPHTRKSRKHHTPQRNGRYLDSHDT
jgi:hypothetical protein